MPFRVSRSALCLWAVWSLFLFLAASPAAAAERPNVVFILADDKD